METQTPRGDYSRASKSTGPPGMGEARPRRAGFPKISRPAKTTDKARISSGTDVVPLAASRCWTWRSKHLCGCLTADDCMLASDLPLHDDQPCPGEFTGSAGWRAHCGGAA